MTRTEYGAKVTTIIDEQTGGGFEYPASSLPLLTLLDYTRTRYRFSGEAEMAKRNRAKEAKEKGRVLRAFELTAEADGIIGEVAAYLHGTGQATGCTRVQAVEWALREAAKKIRKKSKPGLD